MNFNEKVLTALGPFPKKTELKFKVINSEEKQDYTLQTIEYFVEENERVNSVLLIPKNLTQNNPAILAIHQHNGEWHLGKSEVIGTAGDVMYHYGLELCLRGYVVLAPDLLCFEERINDEFLENRDAHQRYEKFEFSNRILAGSCLQTKYLHDLAVAVDVLESLEFVDSNNIGVIGHSLGGQEATWLTWYDQRIKVGISSCGIGQVDTIIRDHITHNSALYVPNFQNIGDTSDIVAHIAPRSFLMTSGLKDGALFPVDGVEKIVNVATDQYETFGKSENFKAIIFDDGHSFNDDIKIEVYDWLDQKLKTTNEA